MRSPRAVLALIAASAIWGLLTPVTKVLVEALGPLTTLSIEVLAAAALLCGVLWYRHTPRTVPWPPLIVLAVLEPVIAYAALNMGLEHTQALNASFLDGLQSLMIVALGAVLLSDALNRGMWIATLISTAGAAVVMGARPSTDSGIGDALVLFGSLGGACAVILVGTLSGRLTPLQLCAYQFGLGAPVTVAIAGLCWLQGWETPPDTGDIPMVMLAIAVGVFDFGAAYLLYYEAIRHTSVITAGVSLNLIPLCGAAASVALLKETFTTAQWGGAGLLMAGLAYFTVKEAEHDQVGSAVGDPTPE